MQPGFWRGKRVLVTGHTGFKGSWLSLWLEHAGARVGGYALEAPTAPSLFEVAAVSRGIASRHGDVRDLESVSSTLESFSPEIVIHLAAQSLVRESYVSPVDTYATNVMGTVNVLEALRHVPSVRVALVATSDKCYENRGSPTPYTETDPLGGYDPYSSSKACAELVTAAYRQSFFGTANASGATAIASARAGNVIGGGDWARDRLVPDLVAAYANGKPALVRRPQAVRPWQHVLEPLDGYLTLCERLWHEPSRYAGAWNFGPRATDTMTVAGIADRLAREWGAGATWKADEGEHPHEAAVLKLDCTKAREQLGWTPRLDLAEALRWTVEWYRAYREGGDMRRVTQTQIERYMSKAVS